MASQGAATLFVDGFNFSQYCAGMGVIFERDTADVSVFGTGSKSYIPGLKNSSFPLQGPADEEACKHLWNLFNNESMLSFRYYPSGEDSWLKYEGEALVIDIKEESNTDSPNTLTAQFQVSGDVLRSVELDFNDFEGDLNYFIDVNDVSDLIYDGSEF